jgi:hypothetical protein
MWWNKKAKERLDNLERKIDILLANQDHWDVITNTIEDIHVAHVSLKIMDKFEEYMKNVDKLNSMINELKGCASMVRASLKEKQTTPSS